MKFGYQSRAVTLLQSSEKMSFNNPNLDLANINVYTKVGQILTYIKGHNSVTNLRKNDG